MDNIASKLESKIEDAARRVSGRDCKLCAQFQGLSAKELFAWTRPTASAIVVGTIAAFLVIFTVFEYSLVLFICRLLQLGFVVAGGLIFSKKLTFTAEDARSSVATCLESFKPIAVNATDRLFRLIAWEEPAESFPLFIGTIVVAFLSAYLEDAFIIAVLTVGAFAGTPLYIKYQKQIDPHAEKLAKEVRKLISQIPIGKSKQA